MSFIQIIEVVAAILAAALLYVALPVALNTYLRLRGKRLVVCPETRAHAGVVVDALRGALASAAGKSEDLLRLSDCSRWPERADCGQECLAQVASSPEECLVKTHVARWYEGKRCTACGKRFGRISWLHCPAALGPGRELVEWDRVAVDRLYEIFRTHVPLCWNCSLVEMMRTRHPERVVDRPPWFPPPA